MKLSCDPIALHNSIFNDLIESKMVKTRFTSRILPIQNTCHASFDEIKEMTRGLAHTLLNNNGAAIKYAVVPKTRNNVFF
jgi:tRNA acetyltransferase TAN1